MSCQKLARSFVASKEDAQVSIYIAAGNTIISIETADNILTQQLLRLFAFIHAFLVILQQRLIESIDNVIHTTAIHFLIPFKVVLAVVVGYLYLIEDPGVFLEVFNL